MKFIFLAYLTFGTSYLRAANENFSFDCFEENDSEFIAINKIGKQLSYKIQYKITDNDIVKIEDRKNILTGSIRKFKGNSNQLSFKIEEVDNKGNPAGNDKDVYVYTITFDPATGLGLKRFDYTVSGFKPKMKLSIISCIKK